MIIVFELTFILLFIVVSLYLIKTSNHPASIVAICASITIVLGEIRNAYVTHSTTYNPDFLVWFPGRSFPLCIVLAGILLTLMIFSGSSIILDLTKCKFPMSVGVVLLSLCLMCMAMPFLEKFCVFLGLWTWERPDRLTIHWFAGVYKFYLLHLAAATLPGFALRNSK